MSGDGIATAAPRHIVTESLSTELSTEKSKVHSKYFWLLYTLQNSFLFSWGRHATIPERCTSNTVKNIQTFFSFNNFLVLAVFPHNNVWRCRNK